MAPSSSSDAIARDRRTYGLGQEIVVILIYTVLMALLLACSYMIFWVLKQPFVAHDQDGAVAFVHFYSPTLLAAPLCLAALLSSLACAVAKARFDQISAFTLGCVGTGYVFILVSLTSNLNHALGSFDISRGDNAIVAIVIGVWLLLIGYAVKAFYDEARDRMSKWLDPHFVRVGL